MSRLSVLLSVAFTLPGTGDVLAEQILFRRGDSNLDGALDIADATHTLGYLFLGMPATIACEDAADSNDDGTLDLADAVHALGFLFLGSAPSPPPFDVCGRDPTAD